MRDLRLCRAIDLEYIKKVSDVRYGIKKLCNETKCKTKDRIVEDQKKPDCRSKEIIIIDRILFLN